MRRYELTEEQFELIEDLLPVNGRRGGQWNDHRTTLNGMFWSLHTGAQWREMSEPRQVAVGLRSVQPPAQERNFLAMAKLAIIQRCFRVVGSPDRP